MRTIKFRAWDGKKMRYDIVPWQWDFVIDRTSWRCLESRNSITGASYMEVPAYPLTEIMQFTGLHDKHGKEIYEGDCLGGSWGDGWIAYCDKCKSFEYFMKDFGCAACLGDIHWYEVVVEAAEADGDIEVIGNIYSNPEILEAKE